MNVDDAASPTQQERMNRFPFKLYSHPSDEQSFVVGMSMLQIKLKT